MSLISVSTHGSEYVKPSYFQTENFARQFEHFTFLLSQVELIKTKAEVKKSIEVSQDEIDEHRYRYGTLSEQIASINEQYKYDIQEAERTGNEEMARLYKEERDRKIEDISANFTNDEHVSKKIISEKEQEINRHFQELQSARVELERYKSVFTYYLKEKTSGKTYSNLPETMTPEQLSTKDMLFVKSYGAGHYLSFEGQYFYLGNSGNPITLSESSQFEGVIAISKDAQAGSEIMNNFQRFKKNQVVLLSYFILGVIALISAFIMLRNKAIFPFEKIEKWQVLYDRVPLDIRIILLLVSSLLTVESVTSSGNLYYYDLLSVFIQDVLVQLVVSTLFVSVTTLQLLFLIKKLREPLILVEEAKDSMIVRIYQAIRDAFLVRKVGTQLLLLLTIVFMLGSSTMLVFIDPRFIIIVAPLLLVVGIPVLFIFMRQAGYLNLIVRNVAEVTNGHFQPDLPVKGRSIFAKLAENINSLKRGVKTSQREQAKSERLKTELISNVSHDLRTPLTSIITYTELLKDKHLDEEDRTAYLDIIDRKSKRLKILIDDLFEATKMATGNIELTKEKVDLCQLLEQALAEYNEAIQASTLHIRVTKPERSVYAYVDGQKMWRVFDNIIGNSLKYSLEQTRVYITLQVIRDQAVITIKNVTKYELGENIDELFERFKRGDTSRQTEGSGLGLAIAKSIVDLHEGTLTIDVDGDLFKVTISLATV